MSLVEGEGLKGSCYLFSLVGAFMNAMIRALCEPPSLREAHVYKVSQFMGIFAFGLGTF